MLRTIIVLLTLGAASTAAAQGRTVAINELSAPTAPAFVLLGVSPAAVERPETPKAFTLSLLNKLASSDGFPKKYALEAAPYWLTSHPALTFDTYQNPGVLQSIRQTFSISIATAPLQAAAAPRTEPIGTKIGLGFRAAVVNGRANPRIVQLVRELETADDAIFDLLDAEDEASAALAKDPANQALRAKLAEVQKQLAAARAKTEPLALRIQALDAERVGFFLNVAAGQAWDVVSDNLESVNRGKLGFWVTPAYRWRACAAPEGCESSVDAIAVVRTLDEPDADAAWDVGGRFVWRASRELLLSLESLRRDDDTSSNRTVGLVEYRIRPDLILIGSFGQDFLTAAGRKPLVSFLGLNLGFGDRPVVTTSASK